jgi:hypothetical protein
MNILGQMKYIDNSNKNYTKELIEKREEITKNRNEENHLKITEVHLENVKNNALIKKILDEIEKVKKNIIEIDEKEIKELEEIKINHKKEIEKIKKKVKEKIEGKSYNLNYIPHKITNNPNANTKKNPNANVRIVSFETKKKLQYDKNPHNIIDNKNSLENNNNEKNTSVFKEEKDHDNDNNINNLNITTNNIIILNEEKNLNEDLNERKNIDFDINPNKKRTNLRKNNNNINTNTNTIRKEQVNDNDIDNENDSHNKSDYIKSKKTKLNENENDNHNIVIHLPKKENLNLKKEFERDYEIKNNNSFNSIDTINLKSEYEMPNRNIQIKGVEENNNLSIRKKGSIDSLYDYNNKIYNELNKINPTAFNWFLEKLEKDQKFEKENLNFDLQNLIYLLSYQKNHYVSSVIFKSLLSLIIELNENSYLFKSILIKKIGIQEHKISQVEYIFNKKLQELSNQIKLHIPIKFNHNNENYNKDNIKNSFIENDNLNTITNINTNTNIKTNCDTKGNINENDNENNINKSNKKNSKICGLKNINDATINTINIVKNVNINNNNNKVYKLDKNNKKNSITINHFNNINSKTISNQQKFFNINNNYYL